MATHSSVLAWMIPWTQELSGLQSMGSLRVVIRVVSPAYLRLLMFLLAILILACASSRPAFLMIYSACFDFLRQRGPVDRSRAGKRRGQQRMR